MKLVGQGMKFRMIMAFALLVFPLLAAVSAAAAVVATETKDAKGVVQITFENDYVKLLIVPAYGGMATEFTYKKTGNQWVIPDFSGQNTDGMFADHIRPPEVWPGECMTSRYDYQIVRNGPQEATVKLSYNLKAAGFETVSGLKLEKEITLKEGSPSVACKVTVINDTAKSKTFVYWLQHAMVKLGKTKDKNYYYRPSARGIRVTYWESAWPTKIMKGEDFIKDPAAGWSGAVNPKDKEGFISLMDYASLDWLYNCTINNTVEWFYKETTLKPGERWQTASICRPTFGFESYSYASRNIIADTKAETADNAVKVVQTLAATEKAAPGEIDCQVKIYSFPERKQLAVQKIRFTGLGLEPDSKTMTFEGLPPEGLKVIKVEITGKNVSETYETYFDPINKEKAYYNQTDYRLEPNR